MAEFKLNSGKSINLHPNSILFRYIYSIDKIGLSFAVLPPIINKSFLSLIIPIEWFILGFFKSGIFSITILFFFPIPTQHTEQLAIILLLILPPAMKTKFLYETLVCPYLGVSIIV